MSREKNFWGWGWADRFPAREARRGLGGQLSALLGFSAPSLDDPPTIDAIALRPSRVKAPDSLAAIVDGSHEARVRHSYGKAYRDIQRGFRGVYENPPDLVARPRTEEDVVRVLDWASDEGVAVVPFGGGTSVVGGVEPDAASERVVTLSLEHLSRVVEIDETSLAARVQAGVLGPDLERQLGARGLTLRHFPQSFEFSSLGGWIATRAGGHFATLYTHIDDLVESTRTVTPRGVLETRRLPGSGAGPSPDRLILGSEGTLGVITEAWMRVRPRPTFRATATIHFDDYGRAVEAVRRLSQSGLYPTNCRLLDRREAGLNFVAQGKEVLIVAFESADHPLEAKMKRAIELVSDAGGVLAGAPVFREGDERSGTEGGAGTWRSAFVDAPYLMNVLVSLGVIVDTFETAVPWDRFEALHTAVTSNVRDAMKRECGAGTISCRFTHVYPDGPAPYYTFIAPGSPGKELEQWAAIKAAASEALLANGATITHHHAVGRMHKPWYERQAPALFQDALRAAKRTLDPVGILNPGVLI
ncbi:MAG: FAD-binding oxidoreductase [Myxococcales bacterium]|nr:FAD-binding oxidoreductase [Myxococcales bacterium]